MTSLNALVEREGNRRTRLTCALCGRRAPATLTRTERGFGCPECAGGRVSIVEIQERVCARYGVRRDEVRGPRRYPHLLHPRWLAIYLSRRITGRTLAEIGRMFGGRDTSTIHSSIGNIERLCASEPKVEAEVAALTRDLDRGAGGR